MTHSLPLPNFGDAIDPSKIPYSHAALYGADCDHPCPPEDSILFEKENRHWITFEGHPESLIADYERLTGVFGDPSELQRWYRIRRSVLRRCVVYTDRSNARAATNALHNSAHVLYWIATLDGVESTPDKLSAELRDTYHAEIAPEQIWAQQVETIDNAYDRSVLFRDW